MRSTTFKKSALSSVCGRVRGFSRTTKTLFSLVFLALTMVVFHSAQQSAIDIDTLHSTHKAESEISVIERTEFEFEFESEFDEAAWNRLTPRKQQQIENYRKEKALILNLHPTHHAGTYFCNRVGRNGIHGGHAPSFACLRDKAEVMPNRCKSNSNSSSKNINTTSSDSPFCGSYKEIYRGINTPWIKEETGPFVEAIRPYFHMISWEYNSVNHRKMFSVARNGRTLDDPDWDHPNLVSVIITRDPISRLLASDGAMSKHYPGFHKNNLSRSDWWDYSIYPRINTDNFFLRILTATPIPERPKPEKGIEKTPKELLELFPTGINETHFEHSKSLLHNFTAVLDIACLEEGVETLGRLLGLTFPEKASNQEKKTHHHPHPKERIGHDDVYEYLVAKNEWDIALYEYSKTISLVRCDDLKK